MHVPRPRTIFQRVNSNWPTETDVPDEVGVIADLQCGGWSTTILSSSGKLYTTGSLDSMNGITIGESTDHFKQLEYLTESTTLIRQFSSGRRHVLALTDDSEIISWDRINAKGLKVFSRNGRDFGGKPVRVAAGWDTSSAYIPETGIVYWKPIKNDHSNDELDALHITERIIPNTAVKHDEKTTIAVTRHIVLSASSLAAFRTKAPIRPNLPHHPLRFQASPLPTTNSKTFKASSRNLVSSLPMAKSSPVISATCDGSPMISETTHHFATIPPTGPPPICSPHGLPTYPLSNTQVSSPSPLVIIITTPCMPMATSRPSVVILSPAAKWAWATRTLAHAFAACIATSTISQEMHFYCPSRSGGVVRSGLSRRRRTGWVGWRVRSDWKMHGQRCGRGTMV